MSFYILMETLIKWDEIAYAFPNFNGAVVEIWEWIYNFTSKFTGSVIKLAKYKVMRDWINVNRFQKVNISKYGMAIQDWWVFVYHEEREIVENSNIFYVSKTFQDSKK